VEVAELERAIRFLGTPSGQPQTINLVPAARLAFGLGTRLEDRDRLPDLAARNRESLRIPAFAGLEIKSEGTDGI
jgi:hypothetical protein